MSKTEATRTKIVPEEPIGVKVSNEFELFMVEEMRKQTHHLDRIHHDVGCLYAWLVVIPIILIGLGLVFGFFGVFW